MKWDQFIVCCLGVCGVALIASFVALVVKALICMPCGG